MMKFHELWMICIRYINQKRYYNNIKDIDHDDDNVSVTINWILIILWLLSCIKHYNPEYVNIMIKFHEIWMIYIRYINQKKCYNNIKDIDHDDDTLFANIYQYC